MTLYRNIFKNAFKNSWRYKYLWFFGLFTALLGNGGELDLIVKGFNGYNFEDGLFPVLKQYASTGVFNISNILQTTNNDPISMLIATCIFLIIITISAFLIWLIMTSQATLVNNSANIIGNKKHNFKQGLSAGIKKFLPVLGLNFLLKIAIYIIFVLLSVPIIMSLSYNNGFSSNLLFIVLFIIFIPLSIVLSFVTKYSVGFVVIKNKKFIQSIKNGFKLFKDNWLVSIEMAIALYVINILVAISLFIVFLILAIPFIFLFILIIKLKLIFIFWITFFIMILFYFILLITTGSMLAVFQTFSWTNLFVELTSKGAVSKITRIFDKVKK